VLVSDAFRFESISLLLSLVAVPNKFDGLIFKASVSLALRMFKPAVELEMFAADDDEGVALSPDVMSLSTTLPADSPFVN